MLIYRVLLGWTSGESDLVGSFPYIWMIFGMNIRQTMMQAYEGTLFIVYCSGESVFVGLL